MKRVLRYLLGGFAIVVGFLVVMLAPSTSLNAQEFYGSAVGTVTDSTGAVVPGATVTITDIGTNEKRTDLTGKAGEYSFVQLVPANYRIEVSQASFKHSVREPVEVQVGGTTRIDIALEVGSATQTVEVNTRAPLLQTDSSAERAEIEGETVQEMPLNGRNPFNLIALTPGVVPGGSTTGNAALNQGGGNTQPGGWGNYAIAGGIAGYSAMFLDGAPNNVLGENDVALVPVQDAIQEFSVLSSSVPAEYGRFAGGVVNMTTKSGTNAFHGSAYEYVRNRDFNSNNWFNKNSQVASGQPNIPPQWTQNQYGVVVDGPIKRDKAFFLFTWEQFKLRQGATSTYEVPTAQQQQGIFTGLAKPLVDPLGNCQIATTGSPNNYTSTITNLAACESPTAKIMQKYYDLPNATGSGYNFLVSAPTGANTSQYNGRVDYTMSDKQRIFGRYTYWSLDELPFLPFPDNLTYNTANPTHEYVTHQVALGDTYTLNSNNILDVRISWLHQQLNGVMPTWSDYGAFGGNWSGLADQFSAKILPYPYLSSEGNSAPKFHPYGPQMKYQTNWGISASLVRIMGTHSVKVGVEARLENQEQVGSENSGSFAFDGTYTGVDFADMLMGYPSNSGNGPGGDNPGFLISNFATGYNYYQAYYAQDDWRATQNLTLNLGLRYELPGSIAEAHNNQTVLLTNTVDPSTHVTGTLGLVNSSIYPSKYVRDLKYDAFAPRLGFAYRVRNDIAVRGGYGLTWLPIDIANGLMPYNSIINAAVATFNNSGLPLTSTNLCSANGYAANCFHTLSNPFAPAGTSGAAPTGQVILPVQRTKGQAFMAAELGGKISGPVPNDPYAYNQQWNFSVSQQFAGNFMFELGYAGAKGTHIPVYPNNGGTNGLNELAPKYMPASAADEAALQAPTPTATTDPGGYSVPAGAITVGQSLRPFFAYSDVGDSLPAWGATNYNAAHVTLQKRFNSGGLVMANYTWAKAIANTDTTIGQVEVQAGRGVGAAITQDWNNHAGETSILSYNVPQRLVVAYILPLPVGQGKRFAANANGVLERIVGGWALNGITSFQTGFPIYLLDGNGNYLTNNLGGGQLRPDYTPGAPGCNNNKTVSGSLSSLVQAGKPMFNTACFAAPADYSFGSEPRVDSKLRSDGLANWDLSLVKQTRITERTNVEFRAEYFNIANRTQFGPPNNDIAGGPNFGTVSILGNNPRLLQLSLRVNF
jgi:hypothetical protein